MILSPLIATFLVLAQPSKPALDHSVYDAWKIFARVELSESGDSLIYEVRTQKEERELRSKAATAPASAATPAPLVKIWAWDDDYLMPEKEKKAGLGEPQLPKTGFRYVFWGTDKRYRIQQQWELETTADYYVTDRETGESELVMEGAVIKYDGFSPDGRYVCYLDCPSGIWYLFDIEARRSISISDGADGVFTSDENDSPCWPFGYNWAKWGRDSREVFIQEKNDIWVYEPESGLFRPLTDGRLTGETYRWRTDVEGADANELYMSIFDHRTKENGLAVLDLESGEVTRLFKGPYTIAKVLKTSRGLVVQKGSFETGYDLFALENGALRQLTDINPQRRDYNWGTVELVSWIVSDGTLAEGLLFKPEDFDSTASYPMLVHFYERNSHNLFAVRDPRPSNAAINIAYYVSNGYLVFIPDIRYEIGHPGRSAVDYVLSGLDMLCENSWVDKDHIGLQGQSWGGYQAAFIATQSDRFAAVCAGAPVANMTSAYSGIRTSTGKSRQYLYEQSQSRIGTDLWDGLDLYVENSPLFFVPQISSPMLVMHADNDGAVPFSQGVELFSALKRCGKTAWLLQYVNEPHDLGSWEARMDYSVRMSEFFAHYLKGAPAPEWME